ncbi:MAG: clostripain-related cysteine peptidase [Pyrinomonadaceae bacterium]
MDNLETWTIMIYLAGDNNLSTEMVYALEEIKKIANHTKDIKLYVYYDGLSDNVPTLYCDFLNEQRAEKLHKGIEFYPSYKIKDKLIDVSDKYNENSASVNNILNFVYWCVSKDFPNEINTRKYAFVISGHTFGFVNRGLFRDEKEEYSMTHPKLKYLFERITSTKNKLDKKAVIDERDYYKRYGKYWSPKQRKERTTPILGKKFELLGFDTCVMSSLEITWQYKKFAKMLVASEGSIPTAGWNYAQILSKSIGELDSTSAKQLAINCVDEFIKQQNKFALADLSVDISAWDLKYITKVEDALADLSDKLYLCFRNKKTSVYHQMKRAITYVHWQCQTYLLEQHIDLSDFCKLLVKEINSMTKELSPNELEHILEVKKSCLKVIKSIKETILLSGFSGGNFQYSNGISMFFPWSWMSYLSAVGDYNKLTFIRESSAGKKWNRFLKKYLRGVTYRLAKKPTKLGDINPNATSVIYNSYDFKDKIFSTMGTTENDGKQFPNSARQFPNSARQFPNSARLSDGLGLFLSEFMMLKNFEYNWNLSGFKSNFVEFKPESNNSGRPSNRPVIIIPRSQIIADKYTLIIQNFDEIRETFPEKSSEIDKLQNLLKNFVNEVEQENPNMVLERLNTILNSKLFTEVNLSEKDLDAQFKKLFELMR